MTRYAVYAVPGLLGADGEPTAVELRRAVEAWYDRSEFHDLTIDARRYGFHATLKAPFRLADGRTETELRTAADAFAAARSTVRIPRPRLARLGAFRALVPTGGDAGVRRLADEAVRSFEGFRAPLDEADLRRRRPESLSPRQRELLERWGYPYVFDEFRFHLTLTDRVPSPREREIDEALGAHFGAALHEDVELRSIALFLEPAPGAPFELLSVHPFADTRLDTDLQETV